MVQHSTIDHTGIPGVASAIDWGEDADITTLDYDDTPSAGVLDEAARADHRHGMPSASGGPGGSLLYPLDDVSGAVWTDHFDGGALDAAWTRRNYVSDGETWLDTHLRIAQSARTNGDGYFRTIPAGDWTIAMAYTLWGYSGPTAWGLGVVNSSGTGLSSNFHTNPVSPLLLGTTTYTTYDGTFVAVPGYPMYLPQPRKAWVRLRKSGTSYYLSYSMNGETWLPEAPAKTGPASPDRIAMMNAPLGDVSATGAIVDIDWFAQLA